MWIFVTNFKLTWKYWFLYGTISKTNLPQPFQAYFVKILLGINNRIQTFCVNLEEFFSIMCFVQQLKRSCVVLFRISCYDGAEFLLQCYDTFCMASLVQRSQCGVSFCAVHNTFHECQIESENTVLGTLVYFDALKIVRYSLWPLWPIQRSQHLDHQFCYCVERFLYFRTDGVI